jgi:hypothetical protein
MLVFLTKQNIKKYFLRVAYGQYPNMFWMFFFIQKNIWSFENVFSHGFFKHKKKILFFCIFGFYNMFVKLQRVLANIPKNIKILFWGEFIYYSPLMFG